MISVYGWNFSKFHNESALFRLTHPQIAGEYLLLPPLSGENQDEIAKSYSVVVT